MSPTIPVGVFEQLVFELGQRESRGVLLIACTPEFAHFSLSDGSALVLLRHEANKHEQLTIRAQAMIEALEQGALKLVAAGGDSAAPGLLDACHPGRMLGRSVHLFAVGEDREVWTRRGSRSGRDLAAALEATTRGPHTLEASRFAEWLGAHQERAQERLRRMAEHQARLLGRRPWATWILAASFAVVYLLQELWGGSNSIPSLVRMGALVPTGPQSTELWRLFSSSFLHGGPMHLAGNTLILVLIGSFLERLLGPSRLLLLWGASVLGGGLAARAVSDAVVIGASAGGWGLMTAAGLLALRPAGLLPDSVAGPLRGNIGRVLVLNLLISFVPGIALSAHLGGGLAGVLVMGSGLGRLGLVRRRGASLHGSSFSIQAARFLGLGAALLLWGSLATAITEGQPWMVDEDRPWVTHSLGVDDWTLKLPPVLGQPAVEELGGGAREYRFGSPLTTPWVVTVRVEPLLPRALTSLKIYRTYEALKRRLAEEPLGPSLTRVSEPIEDESPGLFTQTEHFLITGTGERHRRAEVNTSAAVVVTVDTYGNSPETGTPFHERVFTSLRSQSP